MFDRLRNLLAPPERKSSRSARLIAIESGGRARWTPRDYAALAREGYQCNAIVHRAVRLIAESIGSLSFVLYEGAAELTAHPLLDLLARPNPRQDGASLLEAVSSHLLLAGNAYVEAVGIDGDIQPNVRELYALRPDRMKVVPGPDGWPLAYEYTVSGATVRFEQDAACRRSCSSHCSIRSTIIMGCRRSKPPRSLSTPTTPPPNGTRRCSTTRRGRRARWSMTGRRAR
jgi:phage portal protein BeeE